MRDGGVLGFNSHYSYVFDTQWADLLTHVNTIEEDKADIIQQLIRKVSCAKFIQLSKDEQVKVLRDAGIEDINCKIILDSLPSDFPLLKGAGYVVVQSARSLGLPVCVKPFLHSWMEDEYALKDFSQPFVQEDYLNYEGDGVYNPNVLMFGDATCRYKPEDITWCQELLYHQPAGAALIYGNKESLGIWYKCAAILIRIPKWGDYRQKLAAMSTGKRKLKQVVQMKMGW